MTTAAMNGNGTPVTRAELEADFARWKATLTAEREAAMVEEFARFKAEFKGEVHRDIAEAMSYVVERLGAQMESLRADLTYQIANAARVAAEEHRRELAIVDEKYRDLPGRVGLLERELDEHRRDNTAHGRGRRGGRSRI